ncbi:hypothetical protein LF844_18835 [Metapseudomonas lalkuanensis]|uniref:colicin Z C-terminal domain-related protein n=1 Tax=Metapseudomonas lalkuanensis TaxID=2604832 RepID=UPI001CF45241|nr:colicin Z C-terminal domain-related protein [Pseudomonas lalkuanensis]UCO96716.1 hypothetical protein LF844_18835 [Pseudomonas lalkuanensis]
MKQLEGWAPPTGIWGPWVVIAEQMGGPLSYKVEFDTSSGSSTFDAEVRYFQGATESSDIVVGPGTHTFTSGICACVSRIRFRSHSLGQIITVTVY